MHAHASTTLKLRTAVSAKNILQSICVVNLCAGATRMLPACLQMSYSEDGIYVSVGGFCLETKNGVDETLGFLSALWAFPKKVLYTTPATEAAVAVFRAMYLPGSSWYRSLSIKDQLLPFNPVPDPEGTSVVPFNTWVLPSRPTSIEDVSDPVFVMGKVRAQALHIS